MRLFFINSGIPGSGKTYYRTNNFIQDVLVICPDEKIGYTDEDPWTPKKARDAWKQSDQELKDALANESQKLILFDATFTSPKKRKKYIGWAQKAGVQLVGIYINTGFKICEARNNEREKSRKVPPFILKNMSKALQSPTIGEGFSAVIDVEKKIVYHNGDKEFLNKLNEIINLSQYNKKKEKSE
jgi:predicted kinase